ncbi:MAG: dockerin type I repeat-containing protein [Bacillota bacterium]|nr:dockerin type I repeat-containing protein [Bacillota bacterium]
MMKIKIKTLCVLLSALLVLAVSSVFSSNAAMCIYTGNVQQSTNGGVSLKDATMIQKYLAGVISLTPYQKVAGDVNGDLTLNLKDATMIQKYLASLIMEFPIGQYIVYCVIEQGALYTDYCSGAATVGTPVTITSIPRGGIGPYSYSVTVNGNPIANTSTNPSMQNTAVWTPSAVGTYDIKVVFTDRLENSETVEIPNYQVVNNLESGIAQVKDFYCNNISPEQYDNLTFTADGFMGTAPYEYQFSLNGTVVQPFSSKNTYDLEYNSYPAPMNVNQILTVEVRDANSTAPYQSKSITFSYSPRLVG